MDDLIEVQPRRSAARLFVKAIWKQLRASGLLVAALSLPSWAAAEGAIEQRTEIMTETKNALLGNDFKKLTEMSDAYATQRNRTLAGTWKLADFFYGLRWAIGEKTRAEGEPAFSALQVAAEKWSRQFPNSSAAVIFAGQVLLQQAWFYRGNGFASEIPQEAWPRFREYVDKAKTTLEKNKKVGARSPAWYSMMIEVATAQNWDPQKFQTIFNEAVAREPSYFTTYFNAATYLMPKWHGDLDALDAFAIDAQRRTAATEGSAMYARVYWSAAQESFKFNLFEQSKADWPRMKKGFEEIMLAYPDPWNLNYFGIFAWQAKDKGTFQALLPEIEGAFQKDAWRVSDKEKDQDLPVQFMWCTQELGPNGMVTSLNGLESPSP